MLAISLVAACSDPPKQAFVVDGVVDVATANEASVVGIWEIAGSTPRYYKLGDGIRVGPRFTLGFDVDPPAEALNADGIGIAIVVMLPEFTTVPDGPVDLARLGTLGRSGETGIIYKTGTATGPAWSTSLPLRFSCAQCVRNANGLDRYELIACASVLVEGPAAPLCDWF
jgi:hypothetical protein